MRPGALVMGLIAAIAMAACQPQRNEPPTLGTQSSKRAQTHSEPADGREPSTPPPGASLESAPSTAAGDDTTSVPEPQAGRTPEPSPPDVDPDPERLRGAAAADVTARLGTPAYERHEALAQVWQYRTPDCVLDLILYPAEDTHTVRHIEARDRKGTAVRPRACLRDLLIRHAGAETG